MEVYGCSRDGGLFEKYDKSWRNGSFIYKSRKGWQNGRVWRRHIEHVIIWQDELRGAAVSDKGKKKEYS